MKIGKFTVLAVSAGLIGLGVSQFEMNPMEKEMQNENAPHFITHAEATVLWNKMLNKNEQPTSEENVNEGKKIVKAGFNPMIEPPINDDNSHYITKDEAAKLLDETVAKSKVIAKQVNEKVTEALYSTNKGMDELIAGDVKENANEVKKVLKAQFAPVKTEGIIKAKDKTIDAMVDALEKMRSEPRQRNKENKPK